MEPPFPHIDEALHDLAYQFQHEPALFDRLSPFWENVGFWLNELREAKRTRDFETWMHSWIHALHQRYRLSNIFIHTFLSEQVAVAAGWKAAEEEKS
jgi:hypothetical protein